MLECLAVANTLVPITHNSALSLDIAFQASLKMPIDKFCPVMLKTLQNELFLFVKKYLVF